MSDFLERLKLMGEPPPGESDTIEHEAIRWAVGLLESARTPSLHVSRLVAAAKAAQELAGESCWTFGDAQVLLGQIDAILLAAIAEYEVAQLKVDLDVDRPPDPDVSRLLAAAKAMVAAEKGWIDPSICHEMEDAIADHEAARKGAGG